MELNPKRESQISSAEAAAKSNPNAAAYDAAEVLLGTVGIILYAADFEHLLQRADILREYLPRLNPDIERLEKLVSAKLISEASLVHSSQPSICGRESRSYLEGILQLARDTRLSLATVVAYLDSIEINVSPKSDEEFREVRAEIMRHVMVGTPILDHLRLSKLIRLDHDQLQNVEARLRSELDKLTQPKVHDDPPSSLPPAVLMKDATKQQQAMLDCLWSKPVMRTSEFQEKVWKGKAITDQAVEKAIERLNDLLLEHPGHGFVQVNGNQVVLTRPTK